MKKASSEIKIASKNFPESNILAEISSQLLEAHSFKVIRKFGLAGTMICFESVKNGEVDFYPEYTGTISEAILKSDKRLTNAEINVQLTDFNLQLGPSFGFSNTYALAMRKSMAEKNNISKISHLDGNFKFKYGFSYEFLKRKDGFQKLAEKYSLKVNPIGLEHALSYKAIAEKKLDVIDVYTTDAELLRYSLTTLKDDKKFFPDYNALLLFNKNIDKRAITILKLLTSSINEKEMQNLNSMAVLEKKTYEQIALGFLQSKKIQGFIGKNDNVTDNNLSDDKSLNDHLTVNRWKKLWERLQRHIFLTFTSVMAAILFALLVSVLIYQNKFFAGPILYMAGLFQTIPSIAVLAFMIPLLGTGIKPAIAALFLYSLLPIFRSTNSALSSIDPALREVGYSIGLTRFQILRLVEIPLAVPNILAGIRTATIISIGTATLAAFIGAGGLGESIFTGVALNDPVLILEGALPAALLAIFTELIFELVERKLIPGHLRMKKT